MPLLVVMLVVNQMDRTNIGFVREHLEADLGIGAAAYGLGAGLFFVAYAIFEVPSNMLLERFGARIWLSRIMISWGAVTFAMAFVQGPTSFYVGRFLLGVAEAGFFPGVMYYLTRWLPDRFRGRAVAIFLGGSSTAYIVTGPASGGLLELDGVLGVAGWKWMFLVQGVVSVLLGCYALVALVSRIGDARWLTAGEKAALSAAVAEDDRRREAAAAGDRQVSKLRLAVRPQVLLLCLIFFAMTLNGYAVTFWLPSMVGRIEGLSSFGIGLVSAVPWFVALVVMYLLGRRTDRTGVRRPWVPVMLLLAAGGTFASTFGSPVWGVVLIGLAAVGFKCAASQFWPIAQQALPLSVVAAGVALINSLGNLGGFVAPTAFGIVEETTGSTTLAMYGLAVASVLAAGLALFVRPAPRAEETITVEARKTAR
ncbi:MFS transporter [Saccharopolyspora hirsuta]|uniref:MFS transporter n=2 Tax=Saccharopolyspora hirsuta TaxID=1837 RepID=A0A5M7CDG4_SACHI|nr:MFS transporter [Saccharopolyspora hirsuta]